MKKYFLKITSLATAFFFSATTLYGAQPVSVSLNPAEYTPVKIEIPEKFSFPSELGTLQEFSRSTESDRFVIYIQDAHSVIDAQKNMEVLITYFQRQFHIRLVAVEGTKDDLDPIIFKTFPDDFIKKKILNQYAAKGEISGPELAAIFSPNPAEYFGIEDWGIYEDNYRAYLQASDLQEKVLSRLENLTAEMDAQRQGLYSQAFNTFHDEVTLFRNEKLDLFQLLKFLAKIDKDKTLTEERFPHLFPVFKAANSEDLSQNEDIEVVLRKMADHLKKKIEVKGVSKDLMEFNEKYQNFVTAQIDAGSFLKFLVETGKKVGVSPKLSPSMRELLGQTETLSMIKGSKLFEELETVLKGFENSFAVSPEQKELSTRYARARIIKDLAKLEWTRDQLDEYEKNPAAYLEILGDGAEDINPALDFYKFAVERDQIFLDRIEQVMDKEKAQGVIVLTGGFHTNGFARRLKSKKYSYATIMPKMNSLQGHENYAPVMKGELSYKRFLKTTLYDAFVKDSTLKMVGEMSEPDFRKNIKVWRDAVIRELSRQGRIEESGKYTKYIDELFSFYAGRYGLKGKFQSREEILKGVDAEVEKLNKETLEDIAAKFQAKSQQFFDGFKSLASGGKLNVEQIKGLYLKVASGQPSAVSNVRPLSPNPTGTLFTASARSEVRTVSAEQIKVLQELRGEAVAELQRVVSENEDPDVGDPQAAFQARSYLAAFGTYQTVNFSNFERVKTTVKRTADFLQTLEARAVRTLPGAISVLAENRSGSGAAIKQLQEWLRSDRSADIAAFGRSMAGQEAALGRALLAAINFAAQQRDAQMFNAAIQVLDTLITRYTDFRAALRNDNSQQGVDGFAVLLNNMGNIPAASNLLIRMAAAKVLVLQFSSNRALLFEISFKDRDPERRAAAGAILKAINARSEARLAETPNNWGELDFVQAVDGNAVAEGADLTTMRQALNKYGQTPEGKGFVSSLQAEEKLQANVEITSEAENVTVYKMSVSYQNGEKTRVFYLRQDKTPGTLKPFQFTVIKENTYRDLGKEGADRLRAAISVPEVRTALLNAVNPAKGDLGYSLQVTKGQSADPQVNVYRLSSADADLTLIAGRGSDQVLARQYNGLPVLASTGFISGDIKLINTKSLKSASVTLDPQNGITQEVEVQLEAEEIPAESTLDEAERVSLLKIIQAQNLFKILQTEKKPASGQDAKSYVAVNIEAGNAIIEAIAGFNALPAYEKKPTSDQKAMGQRYEELYKLLRDVRNNLRSVLGSNALDLTAGKNALNFLFNSGKQMSAVINDSVDQKISESYPVKTLFEGKQSLTAAQQVLNSLLKSYPDNADLQEIQGPLTALVRATKSIGGLPTGNRLSDTHVSKNFRGSNPVSRSEVRAVEDSDARRLMKLVDLKKAAIASLEKLLRVDEDGVEPPAEVVRQAQTYLTQLKRTPANAANFKAVTKILENASAFLDRLEAQTVVSWNGAISAMTQNTKASNLAVKEVQKWLANDTPEGIETFGAILAGKEKDLGRALLNAVTSAVLLNNTEMREGAIASFDTLLTRYPNFVKAFEFDRSTPAVAGLISLVNAMGTSQAARNLAVRMARSNLMMDVFEVYSARITDIAEKDTSLAARSGAAAILRALNARSEVRATADSETQRLMKLVDSKREAIATLESLLRVDEDGVEPPAEVVRQAQTYLTQLKRTPANAANFEGVTKILGKVSGFLYKLEAQTVLSMDGAISAMIENKRVSDLALQEVGKWLASDTPESIEALGKSLAGNETKLGRALLNVMNSAALEENEAMREGAIAAFDTLLTRYPNFVKAFEFDFSTPARAGLISLVNAMGTSQAARNLAVRMARSNLMMDVFEVYSARITDIAEKDTSLAARSGAAAILRALNARSEVRATVQTEETERGELISATVEAFNEAQKIGRTQEETLEFEVSIPRGGIEIKDDSGTVLNRDRFGVKIVLTSVNEEYNLTGVNNLYYLSSVSDSNGVLRPAILIEAEDSQTGENVYHIIFSNGEMGTDMPLEDFLEYKAKARKGADPERGEIVSAAVRAFNEMQSLDTAQGEPSFNVSIPAEGIRILNDDNEVQDIDSFGVEIQVNSNKDGYQLTRVNELLYLSSVSDSNGELQPAVLIDATDSKTGLSQYHIIYANGEMGVDMPLEDFQEYKAKAEQKKGDFSSISNASTLEARNGVYDILNALAKSKDSGALAGVVTAGSRQRNIMSHSIVSIAGEDYIFTSAWNKMAKRRNADSLRDDVAAKYSLQYSAALQQLSLTLNGKTYTVNAQGEVVKEVAARSESRVAGTERTVESPELAEANEKILDLLFGLTSLEYRIKFNNVTALMGDSKAPYEVIGAFLNLFFPDQDSRYHDSDFHDYKAPNDLKLQSLFAKKNKDQQFRKMVPMVIAALKNIKASSHYASVAISGSVIELFDDFEQVFAEISAQLDEAEKAYKQAQAAKLKPKKPKLPASMKKPAAVETDDNIDDINAELLQNFRNLLLMDRQIDGLIEKLNESTENKALIATIDEQRKIVIDFLRSLIGDVATTTNLNSSVAAREYTLQGLVVTKRIEALTPEAYQRALDALMILTKLSTASISPLKTYATADGTLLSKFLGEYAAALNKLKNNPRFFASVDKLKTQSVIETPGPSSSLVVTPVNQTLTSEDPDLDLLQKLIDEAEVGTTEKVQLETLLITYLRIKDLYPDYKVPAIRPRNAKKGSGKSFADSLNSAKNDSGQLALLMRFLESLRKNLQAQKDQEELLEQQKQLAEEKRQREVEARRREKRAQAAKARKAIEETAAKEARRLERETRQYKEGQQDDKEYLGVTGRKLAEAGAKYYAADNAEDNEAVLAMRADADLKNLGRKLNMLAWWGGTTFALALAVVATLIWAPLGIFFIALAGGIVLSFIGGILIFEFRKGPSPYTFSQWLVSALGIFGTVQKPTSLGRFFPFVKGVREGAKEAALYKFSKSKNKTNQSLADLEAREEIQERIGRMLLRNMRMLMDSYDKPAIELAKIFIPIVYAIGVLAFLGAAIPALAHIFFGVAVSEAILQVLSSIAIVGALVFLGTFIFTVLFLEKVSDGRLTLWDLYAYALGGKFTANVQKAAFKERNLSGKDDFPEDDEDLRKIVMIKINGTPRFPAIGKDGFADPAEIRRMMKDLSGPLDIQILSLSDLTVSRTARSEARVQHAVNARSENRVAAKTLSVDPEELAAPNGYLLTMLKNLVFLEKQLKIAVDEMVKKRESDLTVSSIQDQIKIIANFLNPLISVEDREGTLEEIFQDPDTYSLQALAAVRKINYLNQDSFEEIVQALRELDTYISLKKKYYPQDADTLISAYLSQLESRYEAVLEATKAAWGTGMPLSSDLVVTPSNMADDTGEQPALETVSRGATVLNSTGDKDLDKINQLIESKENGVEKGELGKIKAAYMAVKALDPGYTIAPNKTKDGEITFAQWLEAHKADKKRLSKIAQRFEEKRMALENKKAAAERKRLAKVAEEREAADRADRDREDQYFLAISTLTPAAAAVIGAFVNDPDSPAAAVEAVKRVLSDGGAYNAAAAQRALEMVPAPKLETPKKATDPAPTRVPFFIESESNGKVLSRPMTPNEKPDGLIFHPGDMKVPTKGLGNQSSPAASYDIGKDPKRNYFPQRETGLEEMYPVSQARRQDSVIEKAVRELAAKKDKMTDQDLTKALTALYIKMQAQYRLLLRDHQDIYETYADASTQSAAYVNQINRTLIDRLRYASEAVRFMMDARSQASGSDLDVNGRFRLTSLIIFTKRLRMAADANSKQISRDINAEREYEKDQEEFGVSGRQLAKIGDEFFPVVDEEKAGEYKETTESQLEKMTEENLGQVGDKAKMNSGLAVSAVIWGIFLPFAIYAAVSGISIWFMTIVGVVGILPLTFFLLMLRFETKKGDSPYTFTEWLVSAVPMLWKYVPFMNSFRESAKQKTLDAVEVKPTSENDVENDLKDLAASEKAKKIIARVVLRETKAVQDSYQSVQLTLAKIGLPAGMLSLFFIPVLYALTESSKSLLINLLPAAPLILAFLFLVFLANFMAKNEKNAGKSFLNILNYTKKITSSMMNAVIDVNANVLRKTVLKMSDEDLKRIVVIVIDGVARIPAKGEDGFSDPEAVKRMLNKSAARDISHLSLTDLAVSRRSEARVQKAAGPNQTAVARSENRALPGQTGMERINMGIVNKAQREREEAARQAEAQKAAVIPAAQTIAAAPQTAALPVQVPVQSQTSGTSTNSVQIFAYGQSLRNLVYDQAISADRRLPVSRNGVAGKMPETKILDLKLALTTLEKLAALPAYAYSGKVQGAPEAVSQLQSESARWVGTLAFDLSDANNSIANDLASSAQVADKFYEIATSLLLDDNAPSVNGLKPLKSGLPAPVKDLGLEILIQSVRVFERIQTQSPDNLKGTNILEKAQQYIGRESARSEVRIASAPGVTAESLGFEALAPVNDLAAQVVNQFSGEADLGQISEVLNAVSSDRREAVAAGQQAMRSGIASYLARIKGEGIDVATAILSPEFEAEVARLSQNFADEIFADDQVRASFGESLKLKFTEQIQRFVVNFVILGYEIQQAQAAQNIEADSAANKQFIQTDQAAIESTYQSLLAKNNGKLVIDGVEMPATLFSSAAPDSTTSYVIDSAFAENKEPIKDLLGAEHPVALTYTVGTAAEKQALSFSKELTSLTRMLFATLGARNDQPVDLNRLSKYNFAPESRQALIGSRLAVKSAGLQGDLVVQTQESFVPVVGEADFLPLMVKFLATNLVKQLPEVNRDGSKIAVLDEKHLSMFLNLVKKLMTEYQTSQKTAQAA